jgi:Glycosyl transferases group 1
MINTLSLFITCVITVYIVYNVYKETYKQIDVPIVSFPFKNMYDDQHNKLNVILISAPFRDTKHEELYRQYKNQGMLFCGISSYLDFPNPIHNPYEDQFHVVRGHRYVDMVDAWLHCFQHDHYIEPFKHIPHMLMTEADLKHIKALRPMNVKKEYDFIYVCLKDNDDCSPGWQSYNRNWDLAKECLEVMCETFHLRGVLVGRENCEYSEKCDGIVKTYPFLPHHEFQELLQKSNFLFVPNISDASPRVITEALCNDIPVLVNKNILGGWHNVIPSVTGEFFSNKEDIIDAIYKLKTTSYYPREWYSTHRGRERTGKELAKFLVKAFPSINNKNMKYAYIEI